MLPNIPKSQFLMHFLMIPKSHFDGVWGCQIRQNQFIGYSWHSGTVCLNLWLLLNLKRKFIHLAKDFSKIMIVRRCHTKQTQYADCTFFCLGKFQNSYITKGNILIKRRYILLEVDWLEYSMFNPCLTETLFVTQLTKGCGYHPLGFSKWTTVMIDDAYFGTSG